MTLAAINYRTGAWLARRIPARRFISPCPSHRAFSRCAALAQEKRKWSTPLAKQLSEAISTTGPVPLASYMRMCLTGDVGGYYSGAIGQGRDQFGTEGDFVTSPEISQVFGELIGIWFVAEWMSQGSPAGVQLIEVGPGRGTLMDDVLRTIQRFPPLAKSIEDVFMVEFSQELRKTQKKLLCGSGVSAEKIDVGDRVISKHGNTPVTWAESLKSIPHDPTKTPFIIAHEFFDALPIHSFQTAPASVPSSTHKRPTSQESELVTQEPKPRKLEWREMMVAPTHPALLEDSQSSKGEAEPTPEFQLILSPSTTRHSLYLPESSPRYKALKSTPDANVEICPDASLFTTDFASRIGGTAKNPKPKPSGAALILDYGTADTIPINSLRGIRHHKRVNPFALPGLVDLSVDVDFTAVAEAALIASEGVEVHGPVTQADFLEAMGIKQRAEMLARAPGIDQEAAKNIERSWKRLVDRGVSGMGKIYKALAIVPENDGKRRPVGFGGDITG